MSKSIAIVGASRDINKFSHKAVKAFASLDYTVYHVNPEAAEIAGLKAYASLADLPDKVQEVSVYLPPEKTFVLLQQLGDYPLKVVYLNPGSADSEVKEKAAAMGLPVEETCSITAQGLNPADF